MPASQFACRPILRRRLLITLFLALLGGSGGLAAQGLTPKTECAAMKDKAIPATAIGLPTKGAVITAAALTAASAAPADRPWAGAPEYCDLTGSIAPVDPKAPSILFRISVPTAWNQKSWHVGGGGQNGSIPMTANARAQSAPPKAPTFSGSGLRGLWQRFGTSGRGWPRRQRGVERLARQPGSLDELRLRAVEEDS